MTRVQTDVPAIHSTQRQARGIRRPRRWSLFAKLSAVAVLAILLAGGATVVVGARLTRDTLRTEIQDEFASAAAGNLSSVAEGLTKAFAVLRGVAADRVVLEACLAPTAPDAGDAEGSPMAAQEAWAAAADDSPLVQAVIDPQLNPAVVQLRRHLAGMPDFVEVQVTDMSGTVVAATRRPDVINQAAASWWAPTYNRGQGSQYVAVYRRVGDPDPYRFLEMAVPIYTDPASGAGVVGFVYARITMNYLTERFADTRPSDRAEILVINPYGQVVTATQADVVGSLVDGSWWQTGHATALSQNRHSHEAVVAEGTPVLLGHLSMLDLDIARSDDATAIKDLGWILFVYEPLRTAYAMGQRATLITWAWGGGVLVVVLVAGYLVTRTALSPLNRLAKFAQGIEGDDAPGERAIYLTGQGNVPPEVEILGETLGTLLDERERLRTTVAMQREDQVALGVRRQDELALLSALGDLTATATDVDDLTQRTVDLLKAAQHFYYVGLYLVDDANRWAILQAGTGESGRSLLARGHRVSAGTGIVGRCMVQGTVQIERDLDRIAEYAAVAGSAEANDVGVGDALPRYARSEIAAPLRSRGNVTGVLVAQSYDADAFDGISAEVLQTLADHLAVAIDSVRLYAEREEAAARLQRAYGELTREAWLDMLGERVGHGYEASAVGTKPLPPQSPESWHEGQRQALSTGEPVMLHAQDTLGAPLSRAVLPIRARGEVIGVLDVSRVVDGPAPEADLTADELAELESLAEQLGLALENARLYELARQGAMEEQMVGRITQRMRETLSVDTVLQTAVAELRELLDLEGVEIRVGTAPAGNGAGGDGATRPGNGSHDAGRGGL